MNLKKILAGAVAAGMLWCNCAVSAAALPQKQSPMRDITTAELVKDMGIGINLAQPQEYFDMAGLPHGTSLLLQGVNVDLDTDPEWLAQYMTDFGFDRALYTYEEQGLAPYREQYKAQCVNLGRRVTYDGGAGIAKDIDEEGRLVVHDESGDTHVFTGEVSVKGIYGAV